MLSAIFFVAVALPHFTSGAPPETLRLVNILYRHGDRSPMTVYPKDKHQMENTWPDGLGWLTNIGKEQQYELGQFLGQRYDGFLNISHYHFNEIHVEASSVERCLMSAYSNLAGLFPPQGDQIWRKDLPWQPIPVQTRPQEEDNKLAQKAPCPRYDQLKQDAINSPYIKNQDIENKEFYQMIEKNTGLKRESVADIWALADTLLIEKIHNLTWNEWVSQPGVWEKIHKLQIESYDLLFNNTEMAKLKGGILLQEVISNMNTSKTNQSNSLKVHMYSAHDTTVASLLRVMDVYNWQLPPYACVVLVELHQVDNNYVVKIFFRNDTTVEPYELVPKGCGQQCSLDSFIEVTKKYIPLDWKAECAEQASPVSLSPASWIALSIGCGVCAILGVVFSIAIIRHCRSRSVLYTQI